MSSSVVSGSGERNFIFDSKTSNEIKDFTRLLTTINKQTFRALIKLAVLDFEGKPVFEDGYQSIKQQAKNPDNIDIIFNGLYTLLNAVLRLPEHSLKPETVQIAILIHFRLVSLSVKCTEITRIPDEFIEDLINIVYGPRRVALDRGRSQQGPHLPSLESLRWRVDVTISNSVLSRVLEPSVLMEMISDEGEKYTFEISPLKFHQLRFSVTSLLKEMEELEKRNILKMHI